MAGSKISFSYTGIGAMLRSAGMVEHMVARAQKIKDRAEADAPVYDGPGRDPHRGRYKDSFGVDGTARGGVRKDRAAGIVTNDAPEAVLVEFGARAHDVTVPDGKHGTRTIKVPDMPARHVLGGALSAAAGDE